MWSGTRVLQLVVTSMFAVSKALQTTPINEIDAQIIEADVGAFSVKMKQLHDTGFTSLRVSTDRPYGIVIPGGGGQRMKQAFMSALIIRKVHHCTIPIFVYFWGPGEDDAHTHEALQGLAEVEVVDGQSLLPPAYHRNIRIPAKEGEWTANDGWVVKVLALYHAPFQAALLLDSDSLPLVNPKVLFSLPAYKHHGSHFWPNYWMGRDAQISHLLGIPEPNLQQQTETGQILLDRHRHADVLEWVWFIVTHHDVMYTLMWGDTGVFIPAFQLAHKMDYHYQSPFLPRMALFDPDTGDYMHLGMIQSSASGHPLFMHRTGAGAGADNPKFTWTVEPHYVTHVTEPITAEQARKLEVKQAGCYSLKVNDTSLVEDLQASAADDEKIAVASVEALAQHMQESLLLSQTKRAYDCVGAWSHGSASCLLEDWD